MTSPVKKKPPLTVLNNVSVALRPPKTILDNLCVTLHPGTWHFVTGATGSGKTTLLRLLSLCLRPTSGSLSVLGFDAADVTSRMLPSLRRKIGMVPQDCRLLDDYSAFENAALPLRVRGTSEAAIRRYVTEMFTWAGLADYLDCRTTSLSVGQRRLIAVIRAVVSKPLLLIADEPTADLDERTAGRVMQLFQELQRHGTTVVVATTDQRLVSRLGADAIHLEGGRAHLRRADLTDSPRRSSTDRTGLEAMT